MEIQILGILLLLWIGLLLRKTESVKYPVDSFYFEDVKSQINEDFYHLIKDRTISRIEDADMLMMNNNEIVKALKYYQGKVHWHLPGNSMIGDKDGLFEMLIRNFGRENIDNVIVPKTYLLPIEYNQLRSDSSRLFILKSNIEAQKGLMIVESIPSLDVIKNKKIVVGQPIVQDVWKYKGLSVSFRFYLMIRASGKGVTGYWYQDGIVSYSSDVIATFNGSKKYYGLGFPITFRKLNLSNYVLEQISRLMGMIVNSLKNEMNKYDWNGNVSNELFGVDFIMDKNQKIWLIEVNMGPGMVSYNKFDGDLRKTILADYWKLVITGKFQGNNFWVSLS